MINLEGECACFGPELWSFQSPDQSPPLFSAPYVAKQHFPEGVGSRANHSHHVWGAKQRRKGWGPLLPVRVCLPHVTGRTPTGLHLPTVPVWVPYREHMGSAGTAKIQAAVPGSTITSALGDWDISLLSYFTGFLSHKPAPRASTCKALSTWLPSIPLPS